MNLRMIAVGVLLPVAPLSGCGQEPDSGPPQNEPLQQAATSELAPPEGQGEPIVPGLPIEPDDFSPEDGFTQLTLADFAPFQGEENTWQEIEGVIVCSGDPKGYVYSNQPYRNFTWRADYRFAPVQDESKRSLANTGFMIHIQPPHRTWPRSLEVQGRWDEMCSIKSNGGVPDLQIQDDEAARQSARQPVGEWNSVEIVSRDGRLSSTLNGQPICTSEAGELTEGLIGLQSELFEVHFRRLRIRNDD